MNTSIQRRQRHNLFSPHVDGWKPSAQRHKLLINLDAYSSEMKKWAELATWPVKVPSSHLDWAPSRHLVRCARPYFALQNTSLREALRHSRKRFRLPDPLELDFGLHKGLSGEREETYSAWLAWILEQFDDTRTLMDIFHIRDNQVGSGSIRARTEEWTETGHEGKSGRVDIKITINGRPTLLLEVKQGSADSADTIKQAGYAKSLPKFRHKVLLAESGEKETYDGVFRLYTWDTLCIEFRKRMTHATTSNLIQRTMALAFVGAVEQNIIGYPGRLRERIKRGEVVGSSVTTHIQAGNT